MSDGLSLLDRVYQSIQVGEITEIVHNRLSDISEAQFAPLFYDACEKAMQGKIHVLGYGTMVRNSSEAPNDVYINRVSFQKLS